MPFNKVKNAQDAKDLVRQYMLNSEKESKKFVDDIIINIMSSISEAALQGATEINYGHFLIMDDPYKIAKQKYLLNELMRLGFKVCIAEENSKEKVVRTIIKFTISWS